MDFNECESVWEAQKDEMMRKMYPGLSDEDRQAIKEFWEKYCGLLLRMFERRQRENGAWRSGNGE